MSEAIGLEWKPGRWWRVVGLDGRLWCETSDEEEARAALESCPFPSHLERLHVRASTRWLVEATPHSSPTSATEPDPGTHGTQECDSAAHRSLLVKQRAEIERLEKVTVVLMRVSDADLAERDAKVERLEAALEQHGKAWDDDVTELTNGWKSEVARMAADLLAKDDTIERLEAEVASLARGNIRILNLLGEKDATIERAQLQEAAEVAPVGLQPSTPPEWTTFAPTHADIQAALNRRSL